MRRFTTLEDLIVTYTQEHWNDTLVDENGRKVPDSDKREAFKTYIKKRLIRTPEHGRDWVLPGFGHAPNYTDISCFRRSRIRWGRKNLRSIF